MLQGNPGSPIAIFMASLQMYKDIKPRVKVQTWNLASKEKADLIKTAIHVFRKVQNCKIKKDIYKTQVMKQSICCHVKYSVLSLEIFFCSGTQRLFTVNISSTNFDKHKKNKSVFFSPYVSHLTFFVSIFDLRSL